MLRFLLLGFSVLGLWMGTLSSSLFAQTTADYTVQVSAVVQTTPPQITFSWPGSPTATAYTVYRKLKTQPLWSLVTNLPGTATGYTENAINVGDAYEYRFDRTEPTYSAYGFIYTGIEAPLNEFRGIAIVVVDTTVLANMQTEFHRFLTDIVGDGYEIFRIDVDRNDPVSTVKNQIVNAWNIDTTRSKTVVLFGRVPVPYSGDIAPDAHIPDHQGAWPADVYYGDMDGTWNDVSVNTTGATRPQNHNVPSDGKFDESTLPSNVDVNLGRIDLANMNSFALPEADLLKQYLEHNHNFRSRAWIPQTRGRIDDNFGPFSGEAFAANGFRNFAPLVGSSNVTTGDYFPDLYTQDFLWSYGCGAGSYTSSGGVGSTASFVTDTVQTAFTSLFGSYFGDWDSDNNFLRAPLASGQALNSFWAGRPHWQVHHMGLGEPIGYGARISQNNQNVYFTGAFPRQIHIALMGDPTLRMVYVNPPSNLVTSSLNNQNHVVLNWTASSGGVQGYHVYKASAELGPYSRVNTSLITATTFTDTVPDNGISWYMVRAVNLETTASGTFFNSSQGITDSIQLNASILTQSVSPLSVCPGDSVDIAFTVTGPFRWNNVFTAELSDAAGSFAAPIAMGTVTGNSPQTIRLPIPFGTPAGTQYRIRVTGSLPAPVTGSDNGQDIDIQGAPIAPTPSNNGPICPGDTLSLIPNVSGTSFLWTGPNGYTSSAANPQINNVNSSHAGIYTLLYKSGICFSSPGTTTVLYNVPVPIAVTSNSPICAGDSLVLNGPSVGNSPTYQWTGPGGQNLTGQNASVPTAFLPYSGSWVLLVTENGCNLGADTFTVLVHPIPVAPVITWAGGVLSSSAPTGNQWYFNGNILPGATTQTYTPTQSGAYHILYTDTNGCTVSSAAEIVYMTGRDGLSDVPQWKVYPNPAQDYLIIEFSATTEVPRFRIFDTSGRNWLMSAVQLDANKYRIDLSFLPKGSWYLLEEVSGRVSLVGVE
jgi:hypothetical protein